MHQPNRFAKKYYLVVRIINSFLLWAMLPFISFAQVASDDVMGVWKNGEGTAMIKIDKKCDSYEEKMVWLKEPNDPENGKPKIDKNNPEPTKQKPPVLGLT